jgi:hypothetical protein
MIKIWREQILKVLFIQNRICARNQGLPVGTIASYCIINKKVVMDILKKKGMLT